MKKIVYLIIISLIICSFASCSDQTTTNDVKDVSENNESSNASVSNDASVDNTQEEEEELFIGIGCYIKFNNLPEMAELKSMLDADEEEVEEYLIENYFASGMCSKKELQEFIDKTKKLNIVHISEEAQFEFNMDYSIDKDLLDAIYWYDSMRIRIISYLDVEKELPKRDEANFVKTISISGHEVDLYDDSVGNPVYPIRGTLKTEDTYVHILFRNLTSLQSVEFMSIDTLDNFVVLSEQGK